MKSICYTKIDLIWIPGDSHILVVVCYENTGAVYGIGSLDKYKLVRVVVVCYENTGAVYS